MIRSVLLGAASGLLVAMAAACPRTGPAPGPVPADVILDAPSGSCAAACERAGLLGCPQQDDCPDSFTKWDQGPAFLRRPDNGRVLRCADVVSAPSKAALQAMGLACP